VIPRRSPWLPALALLVSALAASLLPEAFLLTREGLARGEVWRLWTGHLVHHTAAHFLFDVGAALLLLGFVRSRLVWLALPPVIGATFLVTRPELASYAGLSGVLHGVFALACFEIARTSRGVERVLALAALLGVIAKAVTESITGTPLFTGTFDMGGATVFEAHLAGVVCALLAIAWCVCKLASDYANLLRPTQPDALQSPQ
jgi:rhomboid family GlyGly-CTERM serine protease